MTKILTASVPKENLRSHTKVGQFLCKRLLSVKHHLYCKMVILLLPFKDSYPISNDSILEFTLQLHFSIIQIRQVFARFRSGDLLFTNRRDNQLHHENLAEKVAQLEAPAVVFSKILPFQLNWHVNL